MPLLFAQKRFSLLLPAGRWLLPVLAFLGILLSTLAFAYHLRQQQEAETQTRLSVHAALVTVEIRDRLRQHAQFLQGLRAFVTSLPQLGPADWQKFSDYQNIRTHLPGIQAYGFLPAVPAETAGAFEARARRLLDRPEYRVTPPPLKGVSFPVLYLAPAEGGNLRGLGFDLFSEPLRREAMEQARDADMPIMTRRLQLVPDFAEADRPGFLLFLPIYAADLPTGTVAQRRQALRGYVFMAYRMSDFMQSLNYNRNPQLALEIFDDWGYDSQKGGAQLALLHATRPDYREANAQLPSEERELSFGARTWLLRFTILPSERWPSLDDPTHITLVSGFILASLAGLLLYTLTTQGQRALAQAQRMTQALERSELRYRLAAEGSNDGLWHRDFQADSITLSERAMGLLGYQAWPAHGEQDLFAYLIHPDDLPRRRRALEAHLKDHRPYDLEVRMKRGDGSWGWYHLKGQAIWDEQGTPLLMAGSISDISARKQAEIELRQHRDRLQELVEERTLRLEQALEESREAMRVKSEFLANMSHELRTPLHAMLGFASIGLSKSEGDSKLHRYFERIQQSAERLLYLVNDLLDLAKLEARKMEVMPVLQDLRPVVQQVLGELDPLLQGKKLKVEQRLECTDTRAMVDAVRFSQVLHNLLSNAIRFSPEEGTLILSFSDGSLPRGRRAGDSGQLPALVLVVEDRGPGIPPGELELIFDKFAQSSRTRTGAGGTGLGLAICQEIMAAHRGQIRAENSIKGGARLIATLPRETDSPPQEELQ